MMADYQKGLLPCPFCGEKELDLISAEYACRTGGREMVACLGCGTQGPWGESEQDAANRWNKRNMDAPA